MKGILAKLLGEDPVEKYDPHKFAITRSAAASLPAQRKTSLPILEAAPTTVPSVQRAAPVARPTIASEPQPRAEQRLYGGNNDMAHNPNAQSEPTPLGCWLVNQPGALWPVRQDLKVDTIPLQARVAIASACVAPIGCGSAALYDPESFMSPIETSQPVIATGSLINTYTGEVSDLFEDAMPPPDNGRDAGDAVRERKQAQRRLMAAEGNITASHHKREQQNPIQPGDAGAATQLANFQINADVATEWNERACRDLYFNRDELAPTELEMTRNPFGFEGFNNRIRINPYILPTQDLDEKNWTSNATLLPGGDTRPKNLKTKLRKDRPRTDYTGQVTGIQQADDSKPIVRKSKAARDKEGLTEANRCVNAQALYGDAAAVSSGQVRLSRDRSEEDPRRGIVSSLEGQSLVTASSVLTSLGYRGAPREVVHLGVEGVEKGASAGNAARQSTSKRTEREASARLGVDNRDFGANLGIAQQGTSHRREADSNDQRRGFENMELAGTQRTSTQRDALRRDAMAAGAQNRAFDQGLELANPHAVAEQRTSLRQENSTPANQRAFDNSFENAAVLGVSEQRLGRSDSLAADAGRRMDNGVQSSAFAGSEQRHSSRLEGAQPQSNRATASVLGAGTLLTQRQHLSDKDSRTVDPSSLFSTLTGFDGAGLSMMQRQFLGGVDDLESSAPRMNESAFQAGRVDVSATDLQMQPQLMLERRGPIASENGHKVDVASSSVGIMRQQLLLERHGLSAPEHGHKVDLASLSVRRQNLYGDSAQRDVQGPLAADMMHSQAQGSAKKIALDDRGNVVVMQGQNIASGVHGAFGEMDLGSAGLSQITQERSATPFLDGGYVERNAKVSARNARGEVLSSRRDNFKIGGDTDFQKKSALAAREWKNEMLIQPSVRRSAGEEGQRCTVVSSREPRRARVAKSPFRGHALKEKGGLMSMLPEKAESRYETDDD